MQLKRSLFLYVAAASLVACKTVGRSPTDLGVSLVTDSVGITVYHRGIGYMTDIGFTLSNNSRKPISRAGCGGPGWPDIEKKVDGRWVPAYYQVYLSCRTIPDFSWDAGTHMHEVVHFGAVEKGHNISPELLIDSIDGVYRLRWSFTEGQVADAKRARHITVVSNEFRMTLAPSPAPTSNTR
jgi:hypothetical protein